MKKLEKKKLEERKDMIIYFKNGKPKKSYMLCRNKEYQKEIMHINGNCNIDWICGGLRCPFYTMGCDNKGKDWEE